MEEYHQITINEYLSWKQEIIQRLNASVDNFIVIGYRLKQIRDTEAYRNEGYDNLGKFVQAEFNIGISTASKFMKINDVYSVNGNSMELKEEYRNFGYNKLYEMIALPIEDRQMITPDTPVKDIREIKKFNDEKNAEHQKKDNIDLGELMEGLIRIVFEDAKMEKAFNKIIHGEYRSDSNQREILAALIPAGSRVVRHKTLMVFFSGDGIRLKRIGKDDEMLTCMEFYEIVRHLFQKEWSEIFLEKAPGKDVSFDVEKEAAERQLKNVQKQSQSEQKPEKTEQKKPENTQKILEKTQKPDGKNRQKNIIDIGKIRDSEDLKNVLKNVRNENTEESERTERESTSLEPVEVVDNVMTRWDYLKTLSAIDAADYIQSYMDPEAIEDIRTLKNWLLAWVDGNGKS